VSGASGSDVSGSGASGSGASGSGDELPFVLSYDASFDGLYGLETATRGLDEDGVLRGRVPVRPDLLGAQGRLHGGVPAAIAESLASQGTAWAVVGDGLMVSGLSNDTTVLAPVTEGATLHAEARAHSRGTDLWLWSVELRDDGGALCAFSRVTIAVRPLRRPATA
jgi:uncharacterized protein (TIGR00369 family)